MKQKSTYIQISGILVLLFLMFGLLLSQSQRKYEILDIQSEQNSDAIPIILFLYYLSLLMLVINWWLILFRKKKGVIITTILTIINLLLIAYTSTKIF